MQATRKSNSVVCASITSALLELMAEKPYDDITVSELTERAQVARVSFYRNFDGKDDVLRRYAKRTTEGFVAWTGPNLRLRDPHAYMFALLRHIHDNRDTIDLLFRSNRMDILREEFNRAFGVGCEDRRESARRAFLSGGLFNLVYRWVLAGYDPTPERLADFVYELVPQGQLGGDAM
ncbi:MAG: TetR/AcrR family transcriptional regulator [Atopobiaceae bacterium]|nr:TetR/AcrR family transcriptional regulator [Atopobiaceae bacterium]MBQ6650269.1 TetR/AcrR family transcriptional regulator [Atopobiaceae bacterium]